MAWFGFWIFMAVYVAVDGWLYSKGHEGFFFGHRTDAEKIMRDAQAAKVKAEAGIKDALRPEVSESAEK